MWRLQPKLQQLKFLDLFNNLGDNIWQFLLLSLFVHVLIFSPIFLYKQTGLIIIDSDNIPVYFNYGQNSLPNNNNFNSALKVTPPMLRKRYSGLSPSASNTRKKITAAKIKQILDNSIESKNSNSFVKMGNKTSKSSLSNKKKSKNLKSNKKQENINHKNIKSLKNKKQKLKLDSNKIKNLKEALNKLELEEKEKIEKSQKTQENQELNKNLNKTIESRDLEKDLESKNLHELNKLEQDISSQIFDLGEDSNMGEMGQEIPINGYLMTDINLANDIRSAVGKNWSKPKGFVDISCEFKILVSCDGQSVTILEQKNSKVPAFNIQAKGAVLNTKFPEKCWGKELNLILR